MDSGNLLLCWLLEGTKGGPTRVKLLGILLGHPMNAHQLSVAAKVDYRTVEHHLAVLEKNLVVFGVGGKYGRAYHIERDVISDPDFRRIVGGDKHGKAGKKKRKE